MKKLSQSQIIGNRGEAFASYVLSQYCLVRPVANSTDVGVDLYCESLQSGVPHNHFWVQVKTSARIRNGKVRFKPSDLEYWIRQPIPVFIFILSLDRCKGLEDFKIQVVNFTNKILDKKLPSDNPKQDFEIDEEISSLEGLENFVRSSVPDASSLWLIREGIIRNVKKSVDETYIKNYNIKLLSNFTGQILKNIGRSATLLLSDILVKDNEEVVFDKQRRQLGNILETFKDWGNNDFHFVLGMLHEKNGQYDAAVVCYTRSLRDVNADSRIDHETKIEAVTHINVRIHRCLSHATR